MYKLCNIYNYHETKVYANGDVLPYFRGTLHLSMTFTIPIIAIFFINNFLLLIFLCGKFVSYSSSAILHLGILKCEKTHLRCLLIDKIGVYISVFVTGVPFAQEDILLYYGFNEICFLFGIISLVDNQETVRKKLFILQLIFVMVFIGYKSQWNILWIISSVLYICSLIVFIPCVLKNNNTNDMVEVCLPVIWHKKGRNGCHEDFHNILLIADIFAFANAINYSLN